MDPGALALVMVVLTFLYAAAIDEADEDGGDDW